MGTSNRLRALKQLNQQQIKRTIYRNAPITRGDVAEKLGLSLPTVTTCVSKMLADGVLCECEIQDWSSGPQGGRKPLALDFVPGAAYAVGIELGPYRTVGVVTDVRGTTVAKSRLPVASDDYDAMLHQLVDLIESLLKQVPREKVIGVGIGLPGVIETDRGVIRSTFLRPSWGGHHLTADVASAIDLPVIINNNVRMRISAEMLFSNEKRPNIFAYYFISRGIACPIVAHGDRYGSADYAVSSGEIGHAVIQPGGPNCPLCGRNGCLDALASEGTILEKCRAACEAGRTSILKQLLVKRPLDMKMILEAQALGDEGVQTILKDAIQYIGISLANVANLASMSLVLVDGYIMQSERNRRYLQEVVSQYVYGQYGDELKLEFLPYDSYKGACGAAGKIIKEYWLN